MEIHMTKRKVLPAPKGGSIPKIKIRKAVKAIATKVHEDKKKIIFDEWFDERFEEMCGLEESYEEIPYPNSTDKSKEVIKRIAKKYKKVLKNLANR